MTEEQRREAFIEAIAEATRLYGFELQVGVQQEQLGHAVLIKPSLSIAPAPNWQAPASESQTEPVNGKVSESV